MTAPRMKDVMLDLETMGVGPEAAIVAIGAVEFDAGGANLGRVFYCPVDLETSVAGGGVIEPGAVLWWLRQLDEARREITGGGLPLRKALYDFAQWLDGSRGDVNVWGNGVSFDNVILRQAYMRAWINEPWPHRNDRCYATIKAMRPDIKTPRTGTRHNALDDATSQAVHLMAILADDRRRMGTGS